MGRAMNKQELLQKVPTFTRLTNDQLALLARSVGTQTFERDETIFHQGSIGSTLYIIVDGQVRVYTINEAGQEMTVRMLKTGEFFGELALLDGQPRSASVEAMCSTIALTLHRSTFLHIINAYPSIAASVLEAMAARLRLTTVYAEQMANLPATQRVVRQLLDLATQYGIPDGSVTHIDLHLTQDDLASLSGTTRETVNRVLSNLRDQGLIRVERARVSVLKMQQLEDTRE
jgi:CRP/FNR family transcriptional regulator, cyclic AMP receptor protein